MRAFWLTWMWVIRSFMLYDAAIIAIGIAYGHASEVIAGLICLPINAAIAELCRRQFNRKELHNAHDV